MAVYAPVGNHLHRADNLGPSTGMGTECKIGVVCKVALLVLSCARVLVVELYLRLAQTPCRVNATRRATGAAHLPIRVFLRGVHPSARLLMLSDC